MSTTCRYCNTASTLERDAVAFERTGAEFARLFSTEATWRAHRDSEAASEAYTDARDLFALAGDLLALDPQL